MSVIVPTVAFKLLELPPSVEPICSTVAPCPKLENAADTLRSTLRTMPQNISLTMPNQGQQTGLFVDVTDLVPGAGFPLTGISRVQKFLALQSIADPDPNIGPVAFDPAIGAFRRLGRIEEQLLASSGFGWAGSGIGLRAMFGNAFHLVRINRNLTNDFDRRAAGAITGKSPGELSYFISKVIVRLYRVFWKAARLWPLGSGAEDSETSPVKGTVLFPDPTGLGRSFHQAVDATERRALICHDLIPITHPEYVGTDRHARDFVDRLGYLIDSGAHSFCVSQYTADCLERVFGETSRKSVETDTMPMPSMLYEHALSINRTSRLEPAEPFILYCSTIEVRKNHMLLARIWKRAMDEGVSLPKLVCVGKWGWRVEELRAYLDSNPQLEDQISFLSNIGDRELIDLYRSALFGVMPSRDEGWGLCASECLDFGTPVIVSTAGALQEAASGLMPALDPDDEDGWYSQIKMLAQDDAYRDSLVDLIHLEHRPVESDISWAKVKSILLHDEGLQQNVGNVPSLGHASSTVTDPQFFEGLGRYTRQKPPHRY